MSKGTLAKTQICLQGSHEYVERARAQGHDASSKDDDKPSRPIRQSHSGLAHSRSSTTAMFVQRVMAECIVKGWLHSMDTLTDERKNQSTVNDKNQTKKKKKDKA